ncbi:MAG: amidophosphoribosyltransferase, partial [Clostridiales bacterium]|nr:amidophosphoribosyltransferase [Clostridiales bacterium]
IKPSQELRAQAVRIKLNPIESAVAGKRVIMIDDSIVRGTTIANLVNMLRQAGAVEVHVRISSPPFLHPCYYGTDVPSEDRLIASHHSIEEIRDMIGADSLGYLNASRLDEMLGEPGHKYCDACFTGDYPNIDTGIDLMNEDAASLEK